MIRHTIAALGAAALLVAPVLVSPALAQDEQAGRVAIIASLQGAWTGTGQRMNPATQAMEPSTDAFNIAVISEDGRTFAYWTAQALLISEDLGDGDRRDRTWVGGRPVSDETLPFGYVEGPDPDGNWRVTRAGQIQGPAGPLDQTTIYAMTDGAYTVRSYVTPAGGEQVLVQSMDYVKGE
jgi:hypothetical protein